MPQVVTPASIQEMRNQQQANMTSPAASIAALQSQLAQHIGRQQPNAPIKANDLTEAMMLQSAYLTSELAQLRSQAAGRHPFLMQQQAAAAAQQQHPLEQEVS